MKTGDWLQGIIRPQVIVRFTCWEKGWSVDKAAGKAAELG
jgi:hypothetical protein